MYIETGINPLGEHKPGPPEPSKHTVHAAHMPGASASVVCLEETDMTTEFTNKTNTNTPNTPDAASTPDAGPSQLVVYSMLAFCLITWASAYCFIRIAVATYEPQHLSALRFFFASLFLLLFVPKAKLSVPRGGTLVRLLCYGFCGISLYNVLLCLGEKTVSAGTASFIIGISPLFTALLASVTLKEKIGKRGWLALMGAFVGAGLMSLGCTSSLTISPAVLLLLFAALLTGIAIVLNKSILNTMRPMESTIYGVWAGTLFLVPFLPGAFATMAHAPLNATLACVFLGVFPAALGTLGWSFVLKYSSANRAARFLYLIPVITAIQSSVFLGEPPGMLESIGAIVTLLSVVSASPMVTGLLKPTGPVHFKFRELRRAFERLTADCLRRKTCCDDPACVQTTQY